MRAMYLRFALLVVCDWVANVIGYALGWFVVLFADAAGNLPRCLSWFQTQDATVDGVFHSGGEEPRFVQATLWLRDGDLLPRNALCQYLIRVLWLWRNNAYGFSYAVLGAVGPFELVLSSRMLFAPVVGNEPADRWPAQGGELLQVFEAHGRRYFRYRYVKDRGNGLCYEAYLGWKIDPAKERAMLVCRWSPFRAFEA